MTPSLQQLALRDTPFACLMNRRVYNVLLIATKYDAFMLEDDGRVDEQIFNEYTALSLRYPPRFTQVRTEEEALACLADRNFELVIVMPNMAGQDVFAVAGTIKSLYPTIPIVVLTPFSKEVSRRIAGADLSHIDYVFSWLGNAELLLAIIKLVEDKLNAPFDTESVGVQTILLVENSVRFYSSALPLMYRIVLEQSKEFAKEALNEHLMTLRMRGRPKILLARTYEEAMELIERYSDYLLGVVTDMSFDRKGTKDALAGYKLGRKLREKCPHVPLILQSSEADNAEYAAELHAPFIEKHTKSYPHDLKSQIMKHFGFGDFIIEDPTTHQEILRIHNLKDLQRNIFKIPDDALRHHLKHFHFSRFFYSRAMFPPAEILKAHDVTQYDDMDEARQFIFNLIVQYRRMKNAGVVAVFQKDRFDEYSNFARIGNGSLGGKGRGLAFMGTLIKAHPDLESEKLKVIMPKTVVICTDIFDEFMERNNLYPLALGPSSDEKILEAFEKALLPEHIIDNLRGLFGKGVCPLAVRSSSVLEDSHYQPFAGIYSTYMVPRAANEDKMLDLLRAAIKAVYASVFFQRSKAYMTATQNLIDQEKMAVVLQEVVGEAHGDFFFPLISGVARSLNFYPSGPERTEEGVVQMAVGLGKYIVDGGQAIRFSPRHPKHIMQSANGQMSLPQSQNHFLAIDMKELPEHFETDDSFNLQRLPLRNLAEKTKAARYVLSAYDIQSQRLRPGIPQERTERPVVTFANILQHDAFPLAATLDKVLAIGAEEMGRPVEMEFAVEIEGEQAHLNLLQIRPIVDSTEDVASHFDPHPGENVLLYSDHALGNGIQSDVSHIIYMTVPPSSASESASCVTELQALNNKLLASGKSYVLIGQGRWGSSDPCLGVPVKWADICQARVIVECVEKGHAIEPSQGSHFFQNLTSLGVAYITLLPDGKKDMLDRKRLDAQPPADESAHFRMVELSDKLLIRTDGTQHRAVILTRQNEPISEAL